MAQVTCLVCDNMHACIQGPFSVTWQARCGLPDTAPRAHAEAYWQEHGFTSTHVAWDADNSLVVSNVTTGFTPPEGAMVGAPFPGGYTEFSSSAELVSAVGGPSSQAAGVKECESTVAADWFNVVTSMPPGFVKTADGADIPVELLQTHMREAWHKNYAVMLRAGDLLMLDNLRVQHGRLPFANSEDHQTKMVTLLYE